MAFAVISRNRDLVWIGSGTAAGLLAVAVSSLVDPAFPIGCLALPLALVYPGYALLASAGLEREDTREKYSAALGLSLVCTALGGVVLHLSPWGIRPASWAAFLGAVTFVACFVAVTRRRRRAASSTSSDRDTGSQVACRLEISAASFFAGALVVAIAALVLAFAGGGESPDGGFTELWVTAPHGEDESASLEIGVRSSEETRLEYRLDVLSGGSLLYTWPRLALSSGDTWRELVQLPPRESGPIEIVLSRSDRPGQPYRRVSFSSP